VGESRKTQKGFRSEQSPKERGFAEISDFSGDFAVQRIDKPLLGLETHFRQFSRLSFDITQKTKVISGPLPRGLESLIVEIRIDRKLK
jgi:hypothetical protein